MKDFWKTSGEHVAMAASADMFYIGVDYKNKTNMKVSEPFKHTSYIICHLYNHTSAIF